MVSFPQVSPPKTCMHLTSPLYVQKFSSLLPVNVFCLTHTYARTHTHTHTHTHTNQTVNIFVTIIVVCRENYTKCVAKLCGSKIEFVLANLPVYLVAIGLKGLATFILSLTFQLKNLIVLLKYWFSLCVSSKEKNKWITKISSCPMQIWQNCRKLFTLLTRKIFFLVFLQGNIRRGALCMIISLAVPNCMLVWSRVNLKLHPVKPA